jgi:hypothetical protein
MTIFVLVSMPSMSDVRYSNKYGDAGIARKDLITPEVHDL